MDGRWLDLAPGEMVHETPSTRSSVDPSRPVLLGRASSGCCRGEEIHKRLPPDTWCVTKQDLKILKKQVWAAIKRGSIVPTEQDKFNPVDYVFGPTIYTITEQFIKPVTKEAGGMSWALMRNPQGLKCDIFVTHCWQEGIFEFLDKVLDSWPRGRRNAWCCMLANPQNLDISKLIRLPSTSPFAMALRSASCMLVVSNRHSSIYTRLWCAYEAFLAWEMNKEILTASTSPRHRIWRRALPQSILLGLGGFLGAKIGHNMLAEEVTPFTATLFALAWYPLILLSAVVRSSPWRHFWNLSGTCWSALNLGLLHSVYLESRTGDLHFPGEHHRTYKDWRNILFQTSFATLVYFIVCEIDRARSDVSAEDARQLKNGFTTIRKARCTEASDEAAIRVEIGDRVPSVDYTINVLIKAGISTPDLRQAAERGVDVSGFNHCSFAFMVFMCCTSFPHDMDWNGGKYDKVTTVLNVLGTVFAIIWSVFCFLSPIDQRIYAYQVLQRLCLTVCWPPWYIMGILWQAGIADAEMTMLVVQCSGPAMWAMVLPLSFAGLTRLASLPRCGRRLAQMFVVRGCRQGCRLVCGKGKPAHLQYQATLDTLAGDLERQPTQDTVEAFETVDVEQGQCDAQEEVIGGTVHGAVHGDEIWNITV